MNTARDENGQFKLQPVEDESGQALVLTVLCCGVLLGFMALALDVSMLFRAKRNLQIAADSAATAAALDYLYNHNPNDTTVNPSNVSNANAVGVTAAALDGFSSTAANPSTVTVAPAWDGVYAGTPGYFEATITQANPTTFMGIFNHGSVTVAVRAVAGTPYHSNGCFYTQNKTGNLGKGSSTVYFQGSFQLNSPKCGIEINGTDPNTLYFNNNTKAPNGLFAGSVGVVGGCGGFCSDSNVPIVTGIAPVTNPFQGIAPPLSPPYSSCSAPTGSTDKIGKITYTILQAGAPPGCYAGPVELTSNLGQGTYGFTGDVLVKGNVAADNGTTLVVYNGNFSQATNSTFSITAPTSAGPYQGIALLAPASNTNTFTLEFGNTGGKTSIYGIVDMPGINFSLHDSGGGAAACDLITADFVIGTFDDQTGCLTITSYSETHNSPLKAVALVE